MNNPYRDIGVGRPPKGRGGKKAKPAGDDYEVSERSGHDQCLDSVWITGLLGLSLEEPMYGHDGGRWMLCSDCVGAYSNDERLAVLSEDISAARAVVRASRAVRHPAFLRLHPLSM